MKLLSIDTSGLVAAVALTEDERLIAEYRIDYRKTHSQTLMPMIDELGRATELELAALDSIIVSAGPGSFTGLRIGAATAKGLAFALDIPIVPVSTLDALAWQLYGEEGIICPMMDARRSQVYTGLYRFLRTGEARGTIGDMAVLHAPCAISAEEIIEELNERCNASGDSAVLLGDGVPACETMIREKLKVPYRFSPLWKNRQSAAALADLGRLYYLTGKTVPADRFVPLYLRPSQAEREATEAEYRKKTNATRAEGAPVPLTGLRIRRMTDQDTADAAIREARCLGREAWSERLLIQAVERRDTIYLLAEADGRPAGHAGIRDVCGEGEITNVCVDEEFRRRGIGRMLLSELIRQGREAGIESCTLEVRAGNTAARHLYETIGFESEGKRPGFYEAPREDAVIYRLRS